MAKSMMGEARVRWLRDNALLTAQSRLAKAILVSHVSSRALVSEASVVVELNAAKLAIDEAIGLSRKLLDS